MKKNQNSWIKTVLVLILALLLVACSNEDPTPTPMPEEPTAMPAATVEQPIPEISQPIYLWGQVADSMWVLVGYGDAANPTVVEDGTKATANFSSAEPTVNGSGGCNNYVAGYTYTDDGGLTIDGPIGSTMMACETGGEQEMAYFGALETVTNWTITENGRLELTYDSGQPYEEKLIYAPGETPLVFTTWRLVSYGNPDELMDVEEGTAVTAVFTPESDNNGTVDGNASCNNYMAAYTIDGNNINFELGMSTTLACSVGNEQEGIYLSALGSAQTYEIFGANMQIMYDGGVLNYTALNLPLENVLWQAIMIADQPVPEGIEITALLESGDTADAGTIGGNTGCNNYNSGYTVSHDTTVNPATHSLTIDSPMAMTKMACPDEALVGVEQAYLAALETANGYAIFGDQLVVHTANGDIQFAANRQSLEGILWELVSFGDASNPQTAVEGSPATAEFNRLPTLPSGSVSGNTGCNRYNTTFTANLNELKVNLGITTRIACDGAIFDQEHHLLTGLNAATTYRILGNNLQIPYDEGMVLNFMAVLPPVEPEIDLIPLADTFWYLRSIGDNALIPYTEITAGFVVDDSGFTGTVSGEGGCNAYNADISTTDNAFAVSPISTNTKACASEIMDQEGGYLDWLSSAYAYDRAGDQLLISTENGILTYNSTPVQDQSQELQNRPWYLVSVGNLTAVSFSNATTFFNGDGASVSGNTGCNEFNGAYNAEPSNKLAISGFTVTQAACASEELTRQEEALNIFLPSAVSYLVIGNGMQIQTVDGSVINYTAVPPESPTPPTAVIISQDLGEVGQPLTLDGIQSTPGSLPIVHHQWDMGDGSLLSDPVIVYTYDTPGSYNVSLTVTDSVGQTNTTVKPIQISPVVEVLPPIAVINGPTTATAGEVVAFTASNAQDGAAGNSFQWQSGDGNNSTPSPDNSFATIYAQPGIYYPTVSIADGSGLSDSASMEIVINAALPGQNWILGNTIPGTVITVNFSNGLLSGFGSCNTYTGSYTVPGKSNNVKVDPITSTNAVCSEEIMNQELSYFTALQSAKNFVIDSNSLTVETGSGQLIFFAAVTTLPTVTQ